MRTLGLFGDVIAIIKRDWRLLAALNALFFCVLVIGAAISVISPGLHRSMISIIGADTVAGSMGIAANSGAPGIALASFFSSFTYLLLIVVPSVALPIWGPIMGSSRFFIWGVAYAAPLQGSMTAGNLAAEYVLMLLLGEAYIIAIFACVRQLSVAVSALGTGLRQMLALYVRSVAENLKLLLVAVILLAVASLYLSLAVPALAGLP
jgi:hypothetical protein